MPRGSKKIIKKEKYELPELKAGQIWLTRDQENYWAVLVGEGSESRGWWLDNSTHSVSVSDQLPTAATQPYMRTLHKRDGFYSGHSRGTHESDLVTLVYENLQWVPKWEEEYDGDDGDGDEEENDVGEPY